VILTPALRQRHAQELAAAFDVRLLEHVRVKPEEAFTLAQARIVLCAPITDETTYAVALHEIGHLVAPAGVLRNTQTGDRARLMADEEMAAWEWARHYALDWTPVMEQLARWALRTYGVVITDAPDPTPDPTPADPQRINWNDWS
jgi:hypothetical protein